MGGLGNEGRKSIKCGSQVLNWGDLEIGGAVVSGSTF